MKIPARVLKAFKAAKAQREWAHAPYSKFKVGAALVSGSKVITGCNMENASYGATICAERVAFGKAVSQGVHKFSDVVIVTSAAAPTPPCGMCLQVMAEFVLPTTRVWIGNLRGLKTVMSFSDLNPYAFDRSKFK